jgi:hypothetical protein
MVQMGRGVMGMGQGQLSAPQPSQTQTQTLQQMLLALQQSQGMVQLGQGMMVMGQGQLSASQPGQTQLQGPEQGTLGLGQAQAQTSALQQTHSVPLHQEQTTTRERVEAQQGQEQREVSFEAVLMQAEKLKHMMSQQQLHKQPKDVQRKAVSLTKAIQALTHTQVAISSKAQTEHTAQTQAQTQTLEQGNTGEVSSQVKGKAKKGAKKKKKKKNNGGKRSNLFIPSGSSPLAHSPSSPAAPSSSSSSASSSSSPSSVSSSPPASAESSSSTSGSPPASVSSSSSASSSSVQPSYMDDITRSKTNINNGILRTPKDYKSLIPTQLMEAKKYKPTAKDNNTLGHLAAPLAQAVQREAQTQYEMTELLKRCKTIFDPNTLLDAMEKDEKWADEDSKYGVDDYLWLCDFFNNNIDDDDYRGGDNGDKDCGDLFEDDDEWNDRLTHWKGARKLMKTYLKRTKLKSGGDVCLWILRKSQFGNMTTIVKLALVLTLVPPTSVPVERGFSIRNQIKTALKNRMLVDLMNALMLINVETGRTLEKAIVRRAAEIWMFEMKVVRRGLTSLKAEIEKEYQAFLKEKDESVEEEEVEEEGESRSALDIVFEKEKISKIVNAVQ